LKALAAIADAERSLQTLPTKAPRYIFWKRLLGIAASALLLRIFTAAQAN